MKITIFGASGRTGKEIAARANSCGVKIQKSIPGSDAVIIVFGPRPPYTDIFCAQKTLSIIQTMKKNGVSRLICQTGAMIGDYPQNRSLFFKLLCIWFRMSNPKGYVDRVGQEDIVKTSGLGWTILKPPRLTEGEIDVVLAGKQTKVGLFSCVSRKSLAQFIIEELLHPKFIRQSVFVKKR